jgi:hypothetical protein
MSGASRAIYKAVKSILGSNADPGPEDLTDLGGSVYKSTYPELKNRTFQSPEEVLKVEANIDRSKAKPKTKQAEKRLTNPAFMSVDQTPKQIETELYKGSTELKRRERAYTDKLRSRLNEEVEVFDPDEDEFFVPLEGMAKVDEQMESLTTFNDAYGNYIADPIGTRPRELVSFYSTIDNTIDEIFQRTSKNRPGEKGIRGRELLKRFETAEVKQAELNFIGFENRIKPDEFYTEADLKDIIDKSGIRVSANVYVDDIAYPGTRSTKFSTYQRQFDPESDMYSTNLIDLKYNDTGGDQIYPLQYFEIMLDVSPNFSKGSSSTERLGSYDRKMDFIKGNLGRTSRPAHFYENTLAHARGSIIEFVEGGEKVLLIEELQTDAFRGLPSYEAIPYRSSQLPNRGPRDPIAFSKDEPRSRATEVVRPDLFKDFAEKARQNAGFHPTRESYNKNYPKFSEDVIEPGTDTILVKKGKNVSYERQKLLYRKGVVQYEVDFYNPITNSKYTETIGAEIRTTKPSKPLFADPRSPKNIDSLVRDEMIPVREGAEKKKQALEMDIEFTKRIIGDEDYFGTIVIDPQNVDRKVPVSGISDYVEKLLQASIVHAKKNNVDKIVIPSSDLMDHAREFFGRGDPEMFQYIQDIYDDAVNKALNKFKNEFKSKVEIGNFPLSSTDKEYLDPTNFLTKEGLKTRKLQASKFIDISKLDIDAYQVVARFSRGGLVTAPSSTGLMSR